MAFLRDFGRAFERSVPIGLQAGQNAINTQVSLLPIMQQRNDMKILAAAFGNQGQTVANDQLGETIFGNLDTIAAVPKTMRKPILDSFAAEFEQQTGAPPAKVVMDVLKSGDEETINSTLAELRTEFNANPNVSGGQLLDILADPQQARQTISRAAVKVNEQQKAIEEANDPSSQKALTPTQRQFAAEKIRLESEITNKQAEIQKLQKRKQDFFTATRGLQSQQGIAKAAAQIKIWDDKIDSLQKEVDTAKKNRMTLLTTDTTEIVSAGGTNEIRDRFTGDLIGTTERTPPPKVDAFRAKLVDNRIIEVNRDQNGKFTDLDGNPIPGNQIVSLTKVSTQTEGVEGALTKPGRKTIEEKVFNVRAGKQRMLEIQELFRPEYLELWTQWKAKGLAVLERAGFKLTDEQRELLKDFTTFERRVNANLNATIKEITGAQMSEAEAKRIKKQLTDMFQSPTQFKAAMEDILVTLENAEGRYLLLLEKGLTPQEIGRAMEIGKESFFIEGLTLEDGRRFNKRMDFYAQQVQAEKMTREESLKRLRAEFGLSEPGAPP